MSLYDAIAEIAEDMEKEASSWHPEFCMGLDKVVRGFVRQLRTALKAAGNAPPLTSFPIAPLQSAQSQHFSAIEDAKKEFRKSKLQEEGEVISVLLVGGPGDGICVPVAPETAPVGSKTGVMGAVYEMKEDGKLHFVDGKQKPPPQIVLG